MKIDQFRVGQGPSETAPRILVVRLSSIGDVVMTSAIAEVLKRYYPKAHIAWTVEAKSADVLIGNPYIDEVIIWPRPPRTENPRLLLKDLSVFRQHLRALRERRFDILLDPHGLARTAAIAGFTRIPIRIGFEDSLEGSALTYNVKVTRRRDCTRAAASHLWLLSALGIETSDFRMCMPVSDDAIDEAAGFLSAQGIDPGQPYVCLCPATTWPQKHWEGDRWTSVADAVMERFGLRSVILGGPADSPMVERIASSAGSVPIDAAGKLSLKGSAATLAGSRLTISVDTGLFFIALAQDVSVVGLFGPTTAAHLADEPMATILQHPYPCAPCSRSRWKCQSNDCMRDISVEDVLAAADRVLRAS